MDGDEEVGGVGEMVGGRVKGLGYDCVRSNGVGKDIAEHVVCVGCVGVIMGMFCELWFSRCLLGILFLLLIRLFLHVFKREGGGDIGRLDQSIFPL